MTDQVKVSLAMCVVMIVFFICYTISEVYKPQLADNQVIATIYEQKGSLSLEVEVEGESYAVTLKEGTR